MRISEIIDVDLFEAQLSRNARQFAQGLIDLLRSRGVPEPINIEFGGKHPRLIFVYKGRNLEYPFPGSPSESRSGMKNSISNLKRILDQIDLDPQGRINFRR
jgi:hypothetical protein